MATPREKINSDSAAAASGKDKRNRKRFIVYQNEDGTPDLSNLPDALRPVVTPPPDNTEPAAPPKEFQPAIFKMMLPVIVAIEGGVVADRLHITAEQARQCLTPAPDLADAIAAAAAAVATKYASPLGEWEQELALLAIIATWQLSAFAAMQKYRPIEVKSEPPPPPDNHHSTPATPPPAPPKPSTEPMPTPEESFVAGGV